MKHVQLTLGLVSTLAALAQAHTLLTTLFINGVSQGDATCIRMPKDSTTCTYPIGDLASDDMICGRDGTSPVAYICPVPPSSDLTFEFRRSADGSDPGVIDPGHKGPCAVYVKKLSDPLGDVAAGSGWFKIWEEGHDDAASKWCTEKLIAADGLLTVRLPSGLPSGYYLVRTEILALHNALEGDPQFFVNCAQIFVTDGPSSSSSSSLDIPYGFDATIPGYVTASERSTTFDIYDPVFPYPIPGPPVFFPLGTPSGSVQAQAQGVIPQDCLLRTGDWCGVELEAYSAQDGCWAAVDACDAQAAACYASAPATGSATCEVWDKKCTGVLSACQKHDFEGPPDMGVKLVGADPAAPGPVPPVYNLPGAYASSSSSSSEAVGPTGANATDAATATDTVTDTATPTDTITDAASGSNASGAQEDAPAVSTDGTCGGNGGRTCTGSTFGGCCSRSGQCGTGKVHCGCGCQAAFGQCNK